MKFSLSISVAVGLTSTWGSFVLASPSPPPYPSTRTLVSLLPAQVDPLDDPDYNLWSIEDGTASSSFSANGLDFTLTATGDGTKLRGDANTPVYTKPLPSVGQRLIGAGVSTDADGGSIKLTVSGLPAGEHSISTWHNSWEGLDEIPTLAIIVDDVSHISGRDQSAQEGNMFDSAASFTFFDSTGDTVEILYRPTGGNMYLNGFEIDSESLGRQIRFPHPEHRDDNVSADDGAVTASWLPTFDVDGGTYNVYLGTSPDELENLALELYDPEIVFTDLSYGTTYYWRVDVYTSEYNDVHLGRTWMFRVA